MPQPILILLDYIEKIILDLDSGIKKKSLRKTKVAYEKLTELSNYLKELLPEDFIKEYFKDFDRHMHFISVFLRKKDFEWIRSNFNDIRKEDFPAIKKKIYDLSREERTRKKRIVRLSNKVFIVHGRDDKQALLLQKYLKDRLKVDAVMFDDLPDKGRTIIEQLEYIRDNIGYAFVIVTPDDVGCLTEDIEELGKMLAGFKSVKGATVGKIFGMLHTRARQNVVFELGLFMGALGRKKVCCLLKQDTEERPSDIDGILYKLFNKSVREIFHEIPEELTEAGYEIQT